jgi:hypothetical protein
MINAKIEVDWNGGSMSNTVRKATKKLFALMTVAYSKWTEALCHTVEGDTELRDMKPMCALFVPDVVFRHWLLKHAPDRFDAM